MYRRSRIFALVGLPLVAVAVVLIALAADPADPNPKGTLIPIFAVVAGFMFILFFLQTRDLAAAKRASAVPEGGIGGPIDDPARLSDGELWAAMAIAPIDADAAAAQTRGWEMAESSLSTGKIVTAMIFVFVPLTYILESFVPLLIGVPVLIVFVGAKSIGLIARGGGLDQAYEAAGQAIAPLGLELIERPQVGAGPRWGPSPGMKTEIRGALEYAGTRHGRRVGVRWETGACEVFVGAPGPGFEARSSDGRVRSTKAALPPEIELALESVPRSAAWKNLRVSGDGESIKVRRKPAGEGRNWLCDLWLAERLAGALA